MNEERLVQQEKEWEHNKNLIEREYKIKTEKKEMRHKLKKKKASTSKLLILFLFLNCSLIELFTGYVTVQSLRLAATTGMGPDFMPLITLIGAVVGEVIGFAIYAIKSAKENTAGGIVYETAMANLANNGENEYM